MKKLLLAAVCCLALMACEPQHKISKGVVVSKTYRAPYVTFAWSGKFPISINHDAEFSLCVQDGNTMENFNVTLDDYISTAVGDSVWFDANYNCLHNNHAKLD